MIALMLGIWIYPIAVSILNGYKCESSLTEVTATILEAQHGKQPNVKAQLPNGQIEYFDFPSPYAGLRGWSSGIIGRKNDALLPKLINKTVVMRVGYTQYALFEPTRKIWAIHSDNVDMTFKDFQEAYRHIEFSKLSLGIGMLLTIFCFSLVSLFLYADLRDRKLSSKSRD